ncbi:MAG: hypothetical protein RAP03_04120, partial [Candidatus Electryonea clarkiae]|nr:hypothetical protein [Candidatus Electryonea clarkiae]
MFFSRIVRILLFSYSIAFLNQITFAQEWTHNSPYSCTVYCVEINPHDTTHVLVGVGRQGLWQSTNTGDNWSIVETGLPLRPEGDHYLIYDIMFSPNAPDTVW